MPDSLRPEALRLLDEGLSPKEVAASLGVSLSTIYRWRGENPALGLSEDEALSLARPRVFRRLITLAQQGDMRAIKEVLSRANRIPATQSEAEDIFVRVVEHELDQLSPILASNWLAVWLRIKDHLDKVTSGELPLPPPVAHPIEPVPTECENFDSYGETAQEPSQWT